MDATTAAFENDNRPIAAVPLAQPIPKPPVDGTEPRDPERVSALFGEAASIFSDLKKSPFRDRIVMLVSGLFVILVANMAGQVYLNAWQGDFFSAVGKKDGSLIGGQLMIFMGLIPILLALVVAQTWLHEMTKVRLREWLTSTMLDHWLIPGRTYRLGISANEGVNPDQRIQEDVRNLSELTADLGAGLMYSLLLLLSFIGVLWVLSSHIQFTLSGRSFSIPGYMVWAALAYAALGSWLTWRVGRPLILLNSERYAREADLRFSLVRVSESAEAIALHAGEDDERRIINKSVNSVIETMRSISFGHAQLTWITSGYGWFAAVVPVIVAMPGYLQGSLDLGGLMMVIGAFGQVQQSLRWFVDNFARIADWRATVSRVSNFRDAIQTLDDYETDADQIKLEPHGMGHLAFKNVSVLLADGGEVISEATAYIAHGERVLITGESGSGKSTLFRAIAGLWPWGSGTIYLPPRDEMMFLPQRPYLPLGTLQEAVSYPKGPGSFERREAAAALERVNLASFVGVLDEKERWDKLMSLGQQQRLAFARVLLHRPQWIFLDEATAALDDENQALMMSIFKEELPNATILSIGHRPGLEAYHTRTLQLVPTLAGGARLRRKPRPKREPHWLDRALDAILGDPATRGGMRLFSGLERRMKGKSYLQ
jgi:vitamin B12/bleomycin/antimicrobial peptide transport system ATP-binding/permease protein